MSQKHIVAKMYVNLLVTVVFTVTIFDYGLCDTECVRAVGVLICHRNRTLAANVTVKLMDKDRGLDGDDLLGYADTDNEGRFKVDGCGFDPFGSLNKIDPYLSILHRCSNSDDAIEYHTHIQRIFRPELNDFRTIFLDPGPEQTLTFRVLDINAVGTTIPEPVPKQVSELEPEPGPELRGSVEETTTDPGQWTEDYNLNRNRESELHSGVAQTDNEEENANVPKYISINILDHLRTEKKQMKINKERQ